MFENREIRGFLTVDKSAAGNQFLEVWDTEVRDHRFIHPGRKIVMLETEFRDVLIKIFDSSRVLLSTVRVPISKIKVEQNNIFISGIDMKQDWDLGGKSISHLIMTDYHPTRSSAKCSSPNEIAGSVWKADEIQNEYLIEFRNLGSDKVRGRLSAISSIQVVSDRVSLGKSCTPKQIRHRQPLETFQ